MGGAFDTGFQVEVKRTLDGQADEIDQGRIVAEARVLERLNIAW